MRAIVHTTRIAIQAWCRDLAAGWDRFWFTPADLTTLAAIRICTGLVLLYVHGGCSLELLNFIGPDAWVDATAMEQFQELSQGLPTAFQVSETFE